MTQMLTDTGNMLKDRRFLGKAVTIAFPVAMQGMLNTIVNLVDTMMIGTLGETSIAAVGLANKVFFVFSLLVFGIVSGSGVLAAQYWGNHDVKNIRKVLGLALMISIAGSLCFLIPAQLCPEAVMRIFTFGLQKQLVLLFIGKGDDFSFYTWAVAWPYTLNLSVEKGRFGQSFTQNTM